jgi:hypothetical protein
VGIVRATVATIRWLDSDGGIKTRTFRNALEQCSTVKGEILSHAYYSWLVSAASFPTPLPFLPILQRPRVLDCSSPVISLPYSCFCLFSLAKKRGTRALGYKQSAKEVAEFC